MEKTGICNKKRNFYGLITVSEKGQVAIPAEIRKELAINTGDKLLVIKRDDCQGINLIKAEEINNFINQLTK
jgi:AbrB family looped-hinge helix DNA binding protein